MSATEDIVEADKILRSETEKWGQGFIIKDGITLWNMFHNKYKDIRHGNNFNISNINYNEAMYFMDRLIEFINFLVARAVKEDTRDN